MPKCLSSLSHLSLTGDAASDQNTLSHFILYSQAAWKGTTFWGSAFESVPGEASSPSLCHHKGASQDSDPKATAVREIFLLGYIPTGKHSYWGTNIPTSLSGFHSKQHLTGEQHVTPLFWHVLLQIVKLKAKGLKGVMEKTFFFNHYFKDL